MMVQLLRFLTAGAIFVFATGAQAQGPQTPPWYVAIGAGGAWYDDLPLTGAATGSIDMDTGFIGNVSIGRYLDDVRVFRVEIEGLYSQARIDNNGTASTSGNLRNLALMLNFLYDIQTNSNWVPFLGGGLGASRVELQDYAVAGVPTANDSGNAFSWQFKGGVAYHFNPHMAITLLYRYYGTDNLSYSSVGGAPINSGGTRIQSAELGFRFHF